MSDALESRLIALLGALSEADRHALVRFAEFLASRPGAAEAEEPAPKPAAPAPAKPEPPRQIPRPEGESVIQALRRLSETYPMLNRRELLGPTSELVTQHLMYGRDAAEVIEALEQLYRERYEAYRQGFSGGGS